jgi:hypothetical protein
VKQAIPVLVPRRSVGFISLDFPAVSFRLVWVLRFECWVLFWSGLIGFVVYWADINFFIIYVYVIYI